MRSARLTLCGVLALACGAGCDEGGHGHDHDHGPGDAARSGAVAAGAHDHVHEAPHGGTLVPLEAAAAHLELVLEPQTGELKIYVLDGCAEHGVPIVQPSLELELQLPDGRVAVSLAAQERALTGERVGNSSEFAGTCEPLRGARALAGTLRAITIRGTEVRDVELSLGPVASR